MATINQLVRQGRVRRAKLNYLRNRKGKSAMAVREKAVTAA